MGQACDSSQKDSTSLEMGSPHLIYAPLAGRAELALLIAATGQLTITHSDQGGLGGANIQDTQEPKKNYHSPSSMPLLSHGTLKISQSFAIETYLAALAPRYKGLTPQHRAMDNMYAGIKEDVLAGCAKGIFITMKSDEAQAKKDLIDLFDKWFAILEQHAPASGFINKLSFPTPADLAVLNIWMAFMPFGAAKKLTGYNFDKWGKVKALVDRTAKDQYVAEYLKNPKHMHSNPFGL